MKFLSRRAHTDNGQIMPTDQDVLRADHDVHSVAFLTTQHADGQPTSLAEAQAKLAGVVTKLDGTRDREFAGLERALRDHDFAGARHRHAALAEVLDVDIALWELAHDLDRLRPPEQPAAPAARPSELTFVVGSMNFATWHPMLMPPEKELCLSGVEVSPGVYSLDQAIPLTAARSSSVGFEPDLESIYQALKRFGGFGYGLRAFIHSQPGTGPDATRPSSRDLATQRTLEARYRCIGLITTVDGYLRPFTDRLSCTLTVYGQNVEVIDEREQLYRIKLA